MNQIVLVLASRQEYIFHLQILEAQIHQMTSVDKLQILQTIQFKILKSEQRRVQIESQTLLNYNEPRKILQKIVKRFIKIQAFFYQKLQLYFPIFSQRKQFLPLQRNQLFKIGSNPNLSSSEIIQMIINIQKERLYRQVDSLIRSITKNEMQQSDLITNRNEKFCQEPMKGLQYLNHIHQTYYLNYKSTQRQDPYDILQLDDVSKELITGGGFKSYISCLGNLKNVFIPIETTQEIILFRYEKLQKQLWDGNCLLNKRLIKFYLKNCERVQSSKQITQSVHRLPLRLSTYKKNNFSKGRFSKQENEVRGSHTFQDGFLTDKESYGIDATRINEQQYQAGDIVSNLKQIILGNSKQIETRSSTDQQKKFLLKDQMKPKVIVQSSLILCGKQLRFPNPDCEKKRISSNLVEYTEKDQSMIQAARNAKFQKLGLNNKYHLIKIKQNCSQLKLQQLQF